MEVGNIAMDAIDSGSGVGSCYDRQGCLCRDLLFYGFCLPHTPFLLGKLCYKSE